MMLGIAGTMLLIPVGQEFLKAGAPQGSWLLSLGDVLKHAQYLGLTGLSLPMLRLGACSLPGCCSGSASFHGLSLWLV
jgi:hypothetical protein